MATEAIVLLILHVIHGAAAALQRSKNQLIQTLLLLQLSTNIYQEY